MRLKYGVLAVGTTALLMTMNLVYGQEVPELTPPNNQTEPNNLGDNVTYICTIPMIPNLELLWEVDNRQITPDIIEAFEDRGIFIMSGSSDNESTIIFTQEALDNAPDDGYTVLCLGVISSTLTTIQSPTVFIKVFGPPDPPPNLDVAPFTDTTLLITWDRPPTTLPEVSLTYLITVTNKSAMAGTTPQTFNTTKTFLEYQELEMDCHEFLFEVMAKNDAGNSEPVNRTESIPISPDLSLTDTSLTILYVNVSLSTAAEIAVSFNRATSCSERFSVASHSVLVIGEGGEIVREVMTNSTQDPLRVTVDGITRDAAFTVTIEACNILLCRRSRVLDLLTTDVQTAAALFFDTFISINCTYGAGSLARGCVVTLLLEEGDGAEGREVFWLGREKGTSEVSVQCNNTENSRMAYQVISAADWESDGMVGSFSIPVATNVTEVEEDFPCPTGLTREDSISDGEIAAIVIAGLFVFALVICIVIFFILYCTPGLLNDKKGIPFKMVGPPGKPTFRMPMNNLLSKAIYCATTFCRKKGYLFCRKKTEEGQIQSDGPTCSSNDPVACIKVKDPADPNSFQLLLKPAALAKVVKLWRSENRSDDDEMLLYWKNNP